MKHNRPKSGVATQACLPCKKQKRKCDKSLPKCSLCIRLCRDCNYGPPLSEMDIVALSRSIQLSLYTPASIKDKIIRQASDLIGGEVGFRYCSIEYFRTVHMWFPVVSQARYLERLPDLWHNPKVEHSLLAICILLLITCPIEGEISSDLMSLYTLIKGSISLLDAIGIASLEFLQCQLLVNLFEAGHGMYPAAYISNSKNTMIAAILGIHDVYRTCESKDSHRWVTEEEARVWQGITVLDKYLRLESRAPCIAKIFFSAETPSVTNDIFNDTSSVATSFTSSLAREDYFVSLAEASRLLDRTLTHVNNPTLHCDFNAAEAIQIIKTIMSLKGCLAERPPEPGTLYSDAIAFCNSALLSVFELGNHLKIPQNEYCNSSSRQQLKILIKEVVDMAKRFEANLAITDIHILSPFVLHSIFKAAIILMSGLGEINKFDREEGISFLKAMLHSASKRWLIAKYYLRQLVEVELNFDYQFLT
ncbi:hypothetical protein F5884DRAFT_902138 [Xylogone sp. PMI_703]|nr:hypothetical protein F5884DRAFT_902138 [Xylogone sp. PMI_703]